MHRAAVRRVRNQPLRVHHPIPCLSCDTPELRHEGADPGRKPARSAVASSAPRAGGCDRVCCEDDYAWRSQLILAEKNGRAIA